MFDFLIVLNFILNIINLFLILANLKTLDTIEDLVLDIDRHYTRLIRAFYRKGKK